MKITILKNKITNQDIFNKGLELVKKHLASISFPVEFKIKEISKNLTTESFSNTTVHAGVSVKPGEILAEVDGSDDIACLIFNWDGVFPRPTNPAQHGLNKNGCTPIQIPEQWYGIYPEVLAEFLLHEICHATFYLSGKVAQDYTHNFYTSSYAQMPGGTIPFYLSILKGLSPLKNIYKITTPPAPAPIISPPVVPVKIMFKPKNFTLKELVSPEIYAKYGEKGWEFFDERLLRNIQWLREKLGKAIRVNHDHLRYCGFDAGEFRKFGVSQHNMGRALDFEVVGMTSEEVRKFLIANHKEMPEPNIWVEAGVPHNHMDVRYSDKKGIYLFNP